MNAPYAEHGITAAPTRTRDGSTMIGHVVVATGRDTNDRDAVAIWHVNTAGVSTGAWIEPIDLAEPDPLAARWILQLCLRRPVVAWRPEEPADVLTRLATAAGVAPFPWLDGAVALPEVVDGVASTRSAYEKRTADEVRRNKNVATLEWPVEVPEQPPSTTEGMWRAARLVLPQTSPVARQALMTSMLTKWAVDRWRETTVAVSRRRYLREEFGAQRQLPPLWEARLADAYRSCQILADVTTG